MRVSPRRVISAVAVTAGGLFVGVGVAAAGQDVALTPGVYASWGPNIAQSGRSYVAEGKGVYGERFDATAVGGTEYAYDPQPGGDSAFVSVDYYVYGPSSSGACGTATGTCWYTVDHHRFSNWNQASWHGEYDSTRLVANADRARGYYRACADKSWAPDPCSATSILTTSY